MNVRAVQFSAQDGDVNRGGDDRAGKGGLRMGQVGAVPEETGQGTKGAREEQPDEGVRPQVRPL